MTHNIAVLPGDGIGPEIVEQAVRVLKALGVPFDIKQAAVGGAAFDEFEHPLPPASFSVAG
ncbi:isocitrate/isopropylmalate family dehydrogenase, partial [Achromobacter xylosoxidans]